MAQKVNPIAVRLRFNRSSESSWFSDYYYSTLLYQDLNFRDYLSSLKQPNANKLGFRLGKCIIHHYPKRSLLHLFCLGRKSQLENTHNELLEQNFLFLSPLHTLVSKDYVSKGSKIRKNTLLTNELSWSSAPSYQKKKAIALTSRQSSKSSQESLIQLGNLFFESAMTKFPVADYGVKREQYNSSQFLANLLELHKVTRKCVYGPSQKSRQQVLATKVTKGRRPSKFIDSGWTTYGLSACLGCFSKNKSLGSNKSLSHLYFNFYAMHYFFLKNTNMLRFDKFVDQACFSNVTKSSRRSHNLTKSRYFYLSNVQSIISEKTSTSVSLRPIKVSSIYQSASLIAQEIAYNLEQKKSFRQICRSIFQQISNCKYIKGIRINCSGRLNGAEIAKSSCRKYGETSLHVFSDKIDYAQIKASTPYGILGVKVWVSYV
jgi:Ribosomal protein S3, C-terminal domain